MEVSDMAAGDSGGVALWDRLTPARFALYFVTLLLSVVLSLKGLATQERPLSPVGKMLCVLSVISAASTWYHILSFFAQDRANYPTWYDWMIEGDYFVGAYVNVSDTDAKWWFSSQLLTFVCAMAVMMNVEGWRRAMPWHTVVAVTGFGFFGAISAALPVFFARLLPAAEMGKAPQFEASVKVPGGWLGVTALASCSLAGLFCVYVMRESTALALAGLHLVLYLPAWLVVAVPPRRVKAQTLSKTLCVVYALTGAASLIHHVAVAQKIASLAHGPRASWARALVQDGLPPANHCQSSISLDVLFTAMCCAVYFASVGRVWRAVLFLLACPILSLGGSFCCMLIAQEWPTSTSSSHGKKKKVR